MRAARPPGIGGDHGTDGCRRLRGLLVVESGLEYDDVVAVD
jgi:hypothetical protein